MSRTKNKKLQPDRSAGGGWLLLVLAAAVLLAYSNSLEGEFIFDDRAAVLENPSIRQLWPPHSALWPSRADGSTTEGRPLLNLSLAVNYAIGGFDVTGYHVFNLAVHLLATLTLYGLVRVSALVVADLRPVTTNQSPAEIHRRANGLALAIALLWGLHPLQTESVTYVVQRAESMVGMFYLLVLYCVARAQQGIRVPLWHGLAALFCLAGMATKEVMVTAPVVVALYLWVLRRETPGQLLQRNWRLLTALASTWILLALLVWAAKGRGGTAGFDEGLTPLRYFGMQMVVVLYYLKLCFWPFPLVLDYGIAVIKDPLLIGICGAIVAILVATSLWLLVRRRWLGFLGCAFFLILSPSSSVVPILTQPMAEHRMYLPLACVVAIVVLVFDGLWKVLWKRTQSSHAEHSWLVHAPAGLLLAVSVVMGLQTWLRNLDYRTAISIWQDTVAKRPDNSRAHRQMSEQYFKAGDVQSALAHSSLAIEVHPTSHFPPYDRGVVYLKLKDYPKALRDFNRSVEISPNFAEGWLNQGVALRMMGHNAEAVESFTKAAELKPWWGMAFGNRALARWDLGQKDDARRDATAALEGEGLNDDLRAIMARLRDGLPPRGMPDTGGGQP